MSALFALIDTGQPGNPVVDIAPQRSTMPARLQWADISTLSPQPQHGWSSTLAGATWSFTPPPGPTLAAAQALQNAVARLACLRAITGGFSSSATGQALTYPSDSASQSNIMLAAAEGGALWCANGSAWSRVAHSAAQAAQVRTDLLAHIQAQQATYAAALAAIAAATTVAAVQAIA